ncbi:molybdopterin cofactor-binding domain-containing protein [Pseudoroseomonas sp. WGS1072]|uniref:molybdopterin cofactor-binding domain-containing protein n=1 Tax=Roseomonas sp. WGS1072 TaxID=3366816 RepID=UPI003BEF973C
MKFDTPAGPNPSDRGRVLGQPRDRIDGPLKVSGRAPYAYEYHAEAPGAAYGWILGASIGKGRIARIDRRAAEAAPGVLLVLTHENAPEQGEDSDYAAPQLQGPEILHYGQAVALVVAESLEEARAAAALIDIAYDAAPGHYDLAEERDQAKLPESGQTPPRTDVGDFEAGYARAPVTLDVTYTTPDQSQAMMEPHASMALWEGDTLTLFTSHQIMHWAQEGVAATLRMPQEKLRVVSRYVGGGFGSKLEVYADAVLSALAARLLGRPVKVALSRPLIFNHTTHRAATIQRLRIGTEQDGRIVAIAHESWSGDQESGGTAEEASSQTRLLYAGENRMTRNRLATLDLPFAGSMRAPGEAVGLLALECAMDELAEKLGMDPIELRVRNDVGYAPEEGPAKPFSSRKLVESLRVGAERFGWEKRTAPGLRREGRWRIGLGVAAAVRPNLAQPSQARLRLDGQGQLTVETQMTDIGTGSYTILAQVAAEMLGLPLEAVTVRLGDTDFPKASGSGGSWGANSSGAGVYAAAAELRGMIARKAGFNADDAVFEDGGIRAGNRRIALADIAGAEGLVAEAGIEFGDLSEKYAQASFGAHFCEVAVDADTAEIRIRRMLSVAAAGRVLNPKTARSQCLGGMTMGIGAALMEEAVVDRRHGLFINHDLAEYQVPVHADIPHMDVIFLQEEDDKSSPIKAKGIGELGICGVGAAVANAVYNATGVRLRDYPLTLDKLLREMPAAAA